jgi:hypothetical protein
VYPSEEIYPPNPRSFSRADLGQFNKIARVFEFFAFARSCAFNRLLPSTKGSASRTENEIKRLNLYHEPHPSVKKHNGWTPWCYIVQGTLHPNAQHHV